MYGKPDSQCGSAGHSGYEQWQQPENIGNLGGHATVETKVVDKVETGSTAYKVELSVRKRDLIITLCTSRV